MKTVGFLGGYDKIDLVLFIARILTLTEKTVLIVDGTASQKAKYIVPTIAPTKTYITEFEGFDVAVGFENLEAIKEYLGIGNKPLDYDFVLLDIDSQEAFQNFNAISNYKNCLVTAFDLYSLKRGLEVVGSTKVPIKLTKVFFSKEMTKEENDFLEFLALGYKIKWDEQIYSFPIEMGNYSVTVENQIISKIKLKGFSDHYKNSLQFLTQMLFNEDVSAKEIGKAIKFLERET